jgi:hypothetical protein
MKELMLPCSCGGKSILGRTDILVDVILISSICSICGKKYVDQFEVTHIMRFDDKELEPKDNKIKRIK